MPKHARVKPARRPRPSEATCQKVTMLIADYLNRELDAPTRSIFEEHIRDCKSCLSFLNTYISTLHATHKLTYRDLPPDLKRRALGFVNKKIKPIRRR